ncbi:MAG: copper transporter [Thermoleophilia bacterium]|nr:copper transporter [Thermoleophilia bacterium]
MLTWRYHLLSLVAVFLALGLGVLVGISLSDNGVVETGRSGLTDEILRDIDDLRSRNTDLERERSLNLRFQDDAFPFIISGRLQGTRIALVASGAVGDDILRRLSSSINSAGGQVVTTTILSPGLDPGPVAAGLKSGLRNNPAFADADESSVVPALGRQLAAEIGGRADNPKALTALQNILVDSMSGNYESPVDAVVLVARANDEQSPDYSELQKRLLLGLRELGILAVGAEPSDAPRSEIPLFLSLDVSSVDNIDSRIGQISLIYALSGEKGTYGFKTTADMLIPILRAPSQAALSGPPA